MSEPYTEQPGTKSTPYISHVSDGTPVSIGVIDAIEVVSGQSSLGGNHETDGTGNELLDPLYEVIDPDALDSLCRPRDTDAQTATTISFTYEGYHVTVESTGQITVDRN